jgi:hypothetical protein
MNTRGPQELICLPCARAYPVGEICSRHPNEILLDPSQEAVLDLMEADDLALQQRVHGLWMTIGGVITVPVGFLVAFALAALVARVTGRLYLFRSMIIGLCLGGIGVGVGARIADRRFKPRFRQWLDRAGRYRPR